MRRSWRGRYRNNWYRSRNYKNNSESSSLNNSSATIRAASTSGSSRAPANQLPIVLPISNKNNIWKLYFPSEDHQTKEELTTNLYCFKAFMEKNRNLFDLEKIDHTRSVPLDVANLISDSDFINGWPTFNTELFEHPDPTLRLLEYCLHETFKFESKIKVRVLNHQPVIPLANLKVNYFGKLVTLKGTVIKVGSVGLICTSMAFECSSCHNIQAVVQPQGVFTAPVSCTHCHGGSKYEPLQSSPFTNTTDWQVAKIQEIQSQSLSGTIPRSVEIELQGDLVGTACPGDVLSVTGIVQVRGESKGGEDGKRAARLLQLYIEAVSIHSHRNLSNPTLSFTLKDYYAIQEIHASEDVFRLLVHSLCHTIFGHEAVKAGLILGLIGGTEHDNGQRSNPHVLVVGDPGLGKSQLLQAAAHAAPRADTVSEQLSFATTGEMEQFSGTNYGIESTVEVKTSADTVSEQLSFATTGEENNDRISVIQGKDGTVDVAGHTLNVFFDPPHLLKSVRNNFINKDVLWGDKTASWQDILYVYDIDSKLGHTRALPKLTSYHVDHNKIRKMKVSIAAQVLSARTAAMLKYTDAIRVYVCGASASAGGLTVALGREAGGDFALEAGALVLADKGVCCIDELDKMSSHHSSLLEAMEQGRVSVAKGGVVCSLAARATVLAAANPAGGSYNRSKTVAENLKLNPALLSRFDLVFILLDQPDEKIDAMLSEHVLALHTGQKGKTSAKTSLNASISTSQTDNEVSLSKRLRLKPGEVLDHLPLVLLRKYIAYARRYVHPKLSTEAANALQNFYLELRHNHQGGSHDGTPITTRQLEACIRLTQARARVDLREEATVEDANDVISLVKHSLIDTFSDEFGNIQLSRSINGSGVSSRNKLKKFLDALTRRSHQLGKDVFTRQEMIQIHKAAGVAGDANDLIEAMHIQAYLLLKGSNTYQLIAI